MKLTLHRISENWMLHLLWSSWITPNIQRIYDKKVINILLITLQ